MTFEPKAIPYTRESFLARVRTLKFDKGFTPRGIILHNMGAPNIKQGMSTPSDQREANMVAYYKGMGWHSGPHLNIWPGDLIYEMSDLEHDGVHCSCANHNCPGPQDGFFGIEMLGDFSKHADAFDSGLGAEIRDNAVFALAALFLQFGGTPRPFVPFVRGLGPHHACVHDHHACPGDNVDMEDVCDRVEQQMLAIRNGSLSTSYVKLPSVPGVKPNIANTPGVVSAALLSVGNIKIVQDTLNKLGTKPSLVVDGIMGAATMHALATFQQKANHPQTGMPDQATMAALHSALVAKDLSK
jgi:hypothetical protein